MSKYSMPYMVVEIEWGQINYPIYACSCDSDCEHAKRSCTHCSVKMSNGLNAQCCSDWYIDLNMLKFSLIMAPRSYSDGRVDLYVVVISRDILIFKFIDLHVDMV